MQTIFSLKYNLAFQVFLFDMAFQVFKNNTIKLLNRYITFLQLIKRIIVRNFKFFNNFLTSRVNVIVEKRKL